MRCRGPRESEWARLGGGGGAGDWRTDDNSGGFQTASHG